MSNKSNLFLVPKLGEVPVEASDLVLRLREEIDSLKNRHKETCEMAAKSILYALDLKDHYTFNHSTRVAFYTLLLGREMGLSRQELYDLELASLFHDIGKIGIPDAILNKDARLTKEEFQIMQTHPVKSAEILSNFQFFDQIALFSRHHHERYDGKGYPNGLKGEEIPMFSRIILIADTFDAMTSSRPYRKGLSYQVAFDELIEYSGTQFDPNFVPYFLSGMKKEHERGLETFNLNIITGNFKKNAA